MKRKLCFPYCLVKLERIRSVVWLSEQSMFENSFGYEGDTSSWGNVLGTIREKKMKLEGKFEIYWETFVSQIEYLCVVLFCFAGQLCHLLTLLKPTLFSLTNSSDSYLFYLYTCHLSFISSLHTHRSHCYQFFFLNSI